MQVELQPLDGDRLAQEGEPRASRHHPELPEEVRLVHLVLQGQSDLVQSEVVQFLKGDLPHRQEAHQRR